MIIALSMALIALPAQAQQLPAEPVAAMPAAASKPPVGQGRDGDWAYISRYRAANQALGPATAKRVVFMGDSITEAWARQPFIRNNQNYVGRGISGQTAPQMLVRFRADVIALRPAVVHIMAGTNDVAQNTGLETVDEMFGYIVSMVELSRANDIKVVLASTPPAKAFPWKPGIEPEPQIRALNVRLKAYAARRRVVFADYWPVLSTPDGALKDGYGIDGVHPNAAAYEVMRPIAEQAIEQALSGKKPAIAYSR